MRILVAGATGFIGRHLVSHLLKNRNDVYLLVRDKERARKLFSNCDGQVEFIQDNLILSPNSQAILADVKLDVAVSLAWEGIPNFDDKQCNSNVSQSRAFFTQLGKIGCRKLIVAGTCAEYGMDSGPVSEDSVVNPVSAASKHNFGNNLGVYKNILHRETEQIVREHSMQLVWSRLFFVYGRGQRSDALIPRVLDSINRGKKFEVTTPDTSHDFIYVEDVARALGMIAEKNIIGNTTYNIGSGKLTSIRHIVKKVYEYCSHGCWANELGNDPSPLLGFYADISKIKKEIDWTPVLTVDEGIQATIMKSQ